MTILPELDADIRLFEELSAALQKVEQICPIIPIVAIRWMQMQHPVYAEQAEFLDYIRQTFRTRPSGGPRCSSGIRWQTIIGSLCRCLPALARNVRYLLTLSGHLLWIRWRLKSEVDNLKAKPFDVILKSWCFEKKPVGQDADFYFGDLQVRLLKRGVRSVLLCGAASRVDRKDFARAHTNNADIAELPELSLLPIRSLLSVFVAQLRASICLYSNCLRLRDSLTGRICLRAAEDVLNSETASNGLYFWIAKNAAKTWRPKAFVTLYEGRSWERCAWWGMKEGPANTRIVGYQHSAIFPSSRHFMVPDGKAVSRNKPAVVLCTGSRTQRMVASGRSRSGRHVVDFGSFRGVGEAGSGPHPGRKMVLVMPEGYLDESKLLFNFAMEVARLLPDHRFVFRCHPVLPFARVEGHLTSPPGEFENVVVSKGRSLAEDMACASAVLYRGTSAVLLTILQGIKPIYLSGLGQFEIDPLFELEAWRENARGVENCVDMLRSYAKRESVDVTQSWSAAVKYVEQYTHPVGAESMSRLLDSINA